ncbi:MAG: flippase-like domain-containing protein, partial [Terrimicrobiaceae bacterium]|nr:flippase-like domain-containing protein [Terrimicrobiaceae bacterium]
MKRWISLAVSLGILGLIYWKIDFARVVPVFVSASPWWLVLSLGMVVPITVATAWRLQVLAPRSARLRLGEANRLILLASVLNMVLPSKMGDLAKAGFMARRGHMSGSLALSLVVFEKACDMASLLAWCVLGLAVYPRKDAVFWVLGAAVAAGLAGLVLMLGSRTLAELGFGMLERLAPGRLGGKV